MFASKTKGCHWSVSFAARCVLLLFSTCLAATDALAQVGSIRGMVFDKDFDVPLPEVTVTIVENEQKTTGTREANYVFREVEPGTYTLVFSKQGYTRQVEANVLVRAGQMTEVNVSLAGEFTEMEEFVVQELALSGGTEEGLLALRMESPALLDSISADLMSQAGASDAAGALKLVAGTTVQDGKYAVVRGLPDRYVSAQMNGVRLPTADADKRAVQLDQFPSAVIESIQVSKTFTPDQQGDASGGAVNVVLKGIPDERVLKLSLGTKYKTSVTGRDDFLTYTGGGFDTWGKRDDTGPSTFTPEDSTAPKMITRGKGGVGIQEDRAPASYDWGVTLGDKFTFEDFTLGGLASFYYKRDSDYFDDGVDDSYWIKGPGEKLTPQYTQGSPQQDDFKGKLFDVTKASQELQWGGLAAFGIEWREQKLNMIYNYTHASEDSATLAEDTRTKAYYFPGYDTYDLDDPGNQKLQAGPYLRNETLEYIVRITETLQFNGHHLIPLPELGKEGWFELLPPELDWTYAKSSASFESPDKRLFGSTWIPGEFIPGIPYYGIPDTVIPPTHRPSKPAANFTMGNLQRIWKEIEETSDQYFLNLKLPFTQWSGDEGYVKLGYFNDEVERTYIQDSWSNFNDNAAAYEGDWKDLWSKHFGREIHPVTAGEVDVDYDGNQRITAWYYMVDMPLGPWLNIIGGARYERTDLQIVNDPEADVTWLPPDTGLETKLSPGDADVIYKQDDILPSIGFVFEPYSQITLRGSYSETVARQTFKELTPIQQAEYLGGDVFIGNPRLRMSALENFDLRLDYRPFQGSLVSVSWFRKKITDPIEYVQRIATFAYTTAVNYPEGELTGYEVEVRQQLGNFWDPLEGLTLGGNATFIDSEVTLPADEAEQFASPNIDRKIATRDMMNAPELLYNIYCTYDLEKTGTKLGLFYTVRGDTLVAGAGQSGGFFVPDVYETEYGTLNFSISQKIGERLSVKFQAKNLLDPEIEEVYRVDGEDTTKTSYTKGMEFSISLSGTF